MVDFKHINQLPNAVSDGMALDNPDIFELLKYGIARLSHSVVKLCSEFRLIFIIHAPFCGLESLRQLFRVFILHVFTSLACQRLVIIAT